MAKNFSEAADKLKERPWSIVAVISEDKQDNFLVNAHRYMCKVIDSNDDHVSHTFDLDGQGVPCLYVDRLNRPDKTTVFSCGVGATRLSNDQIKLSSMSFDITPDLMQFQKTYDDSFRDYMTEEELAIDVSSYYEKIRALDGVDEHNVVHEVANQASVERKSFDTLESLVSDKQKSKDGMSL